MDRRESPKAPTLSPGTEAAAVAAGPALGRALERYALRDLKVRKREEYRQQDAADSALIEQLRHKRNEKVEQIDQATWDLRTAHELALGTKREPWIDAHERTVAAKRAANDALAATRATYNPADQEKLESMRVAHQAAQDGFATESHALNLTRESAICRLRERWNEARGRTIDAKRAVAAVRAAQGENLSKERDAQVAAHSQTYQELLTASQIAWEAVRKASLAHAQAEAELARLEQTDADAGALDAAHQQVASCAATLAARQQEARTADRAVAEAFSAADHGDDPAGAMAEAKCHALLVETRDEEATEKVRAQRAVKTYKSRTHAQEQAAFDDLRKRRNAEGEAYTEQVRAVYVARGEREAAVRSDYLDKRAEEWEKRRQMQADTKAYAQSERPAYTEALEKLRVEKNSEQARFSAAVQAINKRRELARGDDRNEVRTAAQAVLQAYEDPAV